MEQPKGSHAHVPPVAPKDEKDPDEGICPRCGHDYVAAGWSHCPKCDNPF